MNVPKIILASASPQRLQLLSVLNIAPDAIVPAGIDESINDNEKPNAYVLRVAIAKAEKISKLYPNDIVLSADTVVSKGRKIFPKANNELDAKKCLKFLSGGSHCVFSAVVIFFNQQFFHKVVKTRVYFKRLSTEDINNYLQSEEWRDKSGCYGIQGFAGSFVIKISGSYSNAVGLPLYELMSLIKGLRIRK